MDINERLAYIKENHDQLLSILPNVNLNNATDLPEGKKNAVSDIVYMLYRDIGNLEDKLSDRLHDNGDIGTEVNGNLLAYYQQNVIPEKEEITKIFEALNPELYQLFCLLDEPGSRLTKNKDVRRTFEVGIEKIVELVQEYPEFEDTFLVGCAKNILSSELIRFEPDKWLINAKELKTVLTARSTDILTVHIRTRLKELYRSYIFENWVSVITTSRSILEYAIRDNCHKWKISLERNKNLETLVDDISQYKPELVDDMDFLREKGNRFIHPEKTTESKEDLFRRKDIARQCVIKIKSVVEELYLPVD